jgi:hypothetical protein
VTITKVYLQNKEKHNNNIHLLTKNEKHIQKKNSYRTHEHIFVHFGFSPFRMNMCCNVFKLDPPDTLFTSTFVIL